MASEDATADLNAKCCIDGTHDDHPCNPATSSLAACTKNTSKYCRSGRFTACSNTHGIGVEIRGLISGYRDPVFSINPSHAVGARHDDAQRETVIGCKWLSIHLSRCPISVQASSEHWRTNFVGEQSIPLLYSLHLLEVLNRHSIHHPSYEL